MNIKYLTKNNGYYQYDRRVPKSLIGHPYWQGKTKWKHPLNLKLDAEQTDVMTAWKNAHHIFETALSNIRDRNLHVIDKRDRRSKAIAHLKMFGLNPHEGSLEGITDDNERNHQLEHIDWIRDHSGAFDDYVHWEQTHQMKARENGSGLMPLDDEIPDHIRLQKEAWVAYTDVPLFSEGINFGVIAQNLEGRILRKVMLDGIKENIFTLPIHDAVAVDLDHMSWACDAMREAWQAEIEGIHKGAKAVVSTTIAD